MTEPMYFLLLRPLVMLLCFSANIRYCIKNTDLCYFMFVPMLPKSYHSTGPQGTFWHHLMHHRILSKTLIIYAYSQALQAKYLSTVSSCNLFIFVHMHAYTVINVWLYFII